MNVPGKVRSLLAAAILSSFAVTAGAQSYPSRPIRLIVPFPPGGSVDHVARIIGPTLSEYLGQNVIIDNKGGASGTIGTYEAARAAADGYTLLMVFDSHAVNQHLYRNIKYDTFNSFDYISLMVSAPMLLATAKNFVPQTVPKMIAYAKANPDKVTYGSSGVGGSNHLYGLAFASQANFPATHVPYKGGGPMLTAILGGEINYVVTTLPVVMQYVKSGQVRALAIGSQARVPQLPDVPTIAEFVPGYEANSWVGMMAPKGVPKDVLAKIEASLRKTLEFADINARLKSEGFNVIASDPEQFREKVRMESERLGRLIKQSNIRVD
ncbi:Bug family tripartite tricarboxylate transporter substrate binding protein [Cupriavidus basilensis]|uniref:Bug family tripartite tricarboxylate transporter substrate binding protein n=1 Tax=Cupriavidus basilensis TaxID=68895 RepID=UPI00157A5678|nr:tripartite tricarboxylate transporter substrate binding protein [Cupriavidus basilensis]NUA31993.1 tripartite tricarboxylate transporter substrate binding protein [Cupriavidus basilensis]